MINGWQRYLSIEEDFLKARYYVSFDIDNVYSDFFSKSVIILGAEIEAAFKDLCRAISGKAPDSIEKYKNVILESFPNIDVLKSTLREDNQREYYPFKGWKNKRLSWWDVYSKIKHSSVDTKATLETAVTMLSAYQLLLFLVATYTCEVDSNEYIIAYTQLDLPRLLIPDVPLGIAIVPSEGLSFIRLNSAKLKQKISNRC